MNKNYDVVIIGGGIIGLSSAYYLLKKNKKVLIIEKNEIGGGASGACDEMILLQSKKPGILLEMAIESLNMYKSLSRELNTDLEFDNRGGMVLINNNKELKIMEEFIEKQRKYGLDVDIIDKRDTKRRQAYANKNIIASTYCKSDSQVNPLKVTQGFLREGIKKGLDVKKKTSIKEIKQKKDGWQILLHGNKKIDTECILNTAGPWAPMIGEKIGVDIPIIPKRGQILITEQIPPIGDTNVWSAEYIARKISPSSFQEKNEKHKRLGIGFAVSQTKAGNYLIGSTREYVGFNKSTTLEAIKIISSQAIDFFPLFKNVKLIHCFAGLRPATPDGKPIIGEVKGKKGLFIAAGHEGDGIALAPITGKIIASMINREKINYDIEKLNINRFDRRIYKDN